MQDNNAKPSIERFIFYAEINSSARTFGLLTFILALFAIGSVHAASVDEVLTGNDTTPAQSCLIPSAGAPSCGITTAPGSNQSAPSVDTHVGNPINVVSGNKYQYELDYRSFASGLTLARHYNSSLSQYNIGFGPGWRHTYQVLMTQVSDNQRNIVQSDGRLISFYKSSTQDAHGAREYYEAHNPEDGYLDVAEQSTWHLPDGKSMVFHGSFLILINLGDHRGSLTLHYKNKKLLSVTDIRGDALTFHYVPGKPTLQAYGEESITQPPGSIASVTLPNGHSINYEYGLTRNLISAQYPDSDSVGYGYSNESWPSHLTLRQSTAEDRISEWRYDESGQATEWIEGGGINGLRIERGNPAALSLDLGLPQTSQDQARPPSSGAVVTYADGRQTQYVWQDSHGSSADHTVVDIACDNCMPGFLNEGSADGSADRSVSGSSENSTDRAATRSTQSSTDSSTDISANNLPAEDAKSKISQTNFVEHSQSGNALDAAIPELWSNLSRSSVNIGNTGVDKFDSTYPTDQGNLPVQLTTSRVGEVIDITIGGVSLGDTGRRSLSEALPPCAADGASIDSNTLSHDRLVALGTGSAPCNLDGLVYAEMTHKLDNHAQAQQQPSIQQQQVTTLASSGSGQPTLGFFHPMRRYCGLPNGKSCADLKEDLEMAQLSRCAYGHVSCEPQFELIPPNDSKFNLDLDRYSIGGFHAELYKVPNEDRYILVFRGTDGLVDWGDNVLQGLGETSLQYDLAIQLAKDINDSLDGAELEFSGHSLGGGLATAAALSTERQATIFNTAALQPSVADDYNLTAQYLTADQYINHVHTQSDPLTILQRESADANFFAIQETPGISTEIPNPDHPWMNERHANAQSFGEAFPPLAWHSMDAVIHVLESLIKYNCP